MTEAKENNIIETLSENGEKIRFEIFDIIEFDEKEYALLSPVDAEEDEEDLVLMRLLEEGDEYVFESIEDDEEFDRVSEYIESLAEDVEEE